ncbi:hypothetical protein ACCQ12_18725 [Xanthomonas sp. NCPPB 1068]|uniref:hypothetical protein n=1 Tax=Xanthomonas sp. NCPPB 1068 TaxID=487525 RepID=UPI0035586FAA
MIIERENSALVGTSTLNCSGCVGVSTRYACILVAWWMLFGVMDSVRWTNTSTCSAMQHDVAIITVALHGVASRFHAIACVQRRISRKILNRSTPV